MGLLDRLRIALLGRGKELAQPPVDGVAAVLNRELAKLPEAHDIGSLIPVLVPRTFSETGVWPGPIYRLAVGDFDQTWAVVSTDNAIVYVSRGMQAHWEGRGLDWRALAMENLRSLARAERFNHVGEREDGSVYLAGMLYGQNLAGARLLVPGLFDDVFPDGYLVAMPEMTCALAFTARPDDEQAAKIDRMITACFEDGTEPVSALRYRPELFWTVASEDRGLPA